jgi:hypothetical protein
LPSYIPLVTICSDEGMWTCLRHTLNPVHAYGNHIVRLQA